MAWPTMPEFSDVVQNPGVCFEDPDLVYGTTALNQRGLPLVFSGNFACVYKVSTGRGDFAVRCFTREVKDQHERYSHLDEHLRGVRPDNFVRFEFLDRGIRVKGTWYPIVKMSWVEGQRLDRFVESNLDRPDIIRDMAARWRGTTGSLRGLHIAHNDLQHGNVMVQNDEALRLVDYDGIFLPRFQGQDSPELGHRNYQHPLRTAQDYDERIDNFPSLVVYLSLLAISSNPGLWPKFYNQENMLFTRDDFASPNDSECFKALRNIQEANVVGLSDYLAGLCSRPVEQVPNLEIILHGAPSPASAPPPILPATPIPPLATGQSSVTASSPAAAPPPASGPSYRDLLQTGQVHTPPPVITSALPQPAQVIQCPRCKQSNPMELIYCANESCIAVIHPGRQICNACQSSIPVNAFFCRECGAKLTVPTKV